MSTNLQSTQAYPSPPQCRGSLFSAGQPVTVESTNAAPLKVSQHNASSVDGVPQLPLQARQFRSPRIPHYRPAVLRPTERPIRHSPMTPPQSSSNSLDSLQGPDSPRPLSRQSTGGSMNKFGFVRAADANYAGDDSSIKVVAPPTRDHWKVSRACSETWLAPATFLALLCCRTNAISRIQTSWALETFQVEREQVDLYGRWDVYTVYASKTGLGHLSHNDVIISSHLTH